MRQIAGVLIVLVAVAVAAKTNTEEGDFRVAVQKENAPQRVKSLEQFLAAHPQSGLKLDALELLVWNCRSGGSLADLEHWTSELLVTSPHNPLAAAVIIGNSLPIGNPEPPADRAKNAINALDHFDRPEGLSHDDFAALKNYVVATLNGVVGYSYFEQKDFAAARPYLRKSVALFPDNPQLTYTLALSDLEGSKEDQAEGYKYLARSVNLTQGTPAGESLAVFARQKYTDAGGSSTDWDKYLAAAPVPPRRAVAEPVENASAVPRESPAAGTPAPATSSSPSGSPAASTAAGSSSQPVTNSASAGTPGNRPPVITATAPPASKPATTTSGSATPTVNRNAPAGSTSPALTPAKPASGSSAEVAMATPPPPPPPDKPAYRVMPPRHIPQLVRGAPMSIGLLIQSALAQKQSREPIVYSLTDMVRRMHPYDEAFVMSFSKGMVFQEDLTSNDKALESAMDSIAPEPGSAVYDAVTFAAGHLNRIARNPNRVLIVIAGEGDRSSAVSPLELSSELNVSGVRIYCIGVNVYAPSDQARLRQLAAYTGGQAYFLNGSGEVRSAIRSIAGDLGISYPN